MNAEIKKIVTKLSNRRKNKRKQKSSSSKSKSDFLRRLKREVKSATVKAATFGSKNNRLPTIKAAFGKWSHADAKDGANHANKPLHRKRKINRQKFSDKAKHKRRLKRVAA